MHQNIRHVNNHKKRFTQQEINFLRQNYLQGSAYCANALKRSIKSIQDKCFRLKLKSTSESRSRPRIKPFHKYAVNPEQFLKPAIAEVCYILGLLWADGTVNISGKNMRTVLLSTTYPDSDYFEPIFKKTGNWKIFKKQYNSTWKPAVKIYTNNRVLTDFLVDYKYKTKHNSPDAILAIIPEHLRHYWFRGFFDGDGCITVNKAGSWRFYLTGPYEQDWSFVQKIFEEFHIKFVAKQHVSAKGHKSSSIRVCKKADVFTFMNYIYKEAAIDGLALPRKYQKYQQMISSVLPHKSQ